MATPQNFYTVTAHKASAVITSLSANFTSPTDRNLLIAKFNRIEIVLVTEQGLHPIKEIALYGKIEIMKVFRPKYKDKDLLFIVTARYNTMILECVQTANGDIEIITRAHGNISDQVGKVSEIGTMAVIDPNARVIGLKLYDGLFKIIPLDKEGELKAYCLRMEELEVQDIDFLYGCANPTIIIIHQDSNGRHIKAKELSIKDKEFVKTPWKQENVETEASLIIPVPEPLSGAIIIGRESVLYHNGTSFIAISPPVIKSTIVCYARIDTEGTRYLLGDMAGHLFMLLLNYEINSDGTFKIKDPKVDLLGEISIPESLTYLDNKIIYVASRVGDSQLIKLHKKPDHTGSHITILDTFTNLGPIVDMCVIDLERQGQGQVVTCSGAYKEGSLRIIRNGIGIQEVATIELVGIKGMWPLSVAIDSVLDDSLVLSFVGHSRVLTYQGDEVEEIDVEGFQSDLQTFYCGNTLDNKMVQITSASVRLICLKSKRLVSEWKVPVEERINVVSCNDQKAICATGNSLYYIEIETDQVLQKGNITLEHEVSCLDICSFKDEVGKTINLLAVGLWMDISVKILKLPEFVELVREPLGEEIIPRSILMVSFENKNYLLCALGDGSLCYFHLNPENGVLSDKRKVNLGTQPTLIKKFRSLSTTSVFACSDHPTVIYSSNNKLIFSNVNLRKVNHMCSLNTKSYPDSLAMATDNSIIIGTIDEMQKLHIRTIPLGEAPRRITHQESTKSFGVITMRIDVHEGINLVPARISASTSAQNVTNGGNHRSVPHNSSVATNTQGPLNIGGNEYGLEVEVHNMLILDQNTFEVLHAYQLNSNEYALSIISAKLGDDPTIYYILGSAVVNPEDQDPKIGRILIFNWDDSSSKLTQITEKEVKGACYALAEFNGKLLAAVNCTVRLFEWTAEKELRLECSHFNNIVALFVKTKGDFIVCGDLMRSLTLLQYKNMEGSFDEIARDYNPKWSTAIEIIDDDLFLGAENDKNLFIAHKDSTLANDEARHQLQEIGQFHLGDLVNVFRHGSLVMQHFTDSYVSVQGGILYGTCSGALGLVTQLTPKMFDFLSDLERSLANVIKGVGKIKHSFWRSYNTEIRTEPSEAFVDGDLIECFLDLSKPDMMAVVLGLKGAYDNQFKKISKETMIDLDDVIKLVEDLTRIH